MQNKPAAFVGKYLRGVSYWKLQVYDAREWPIRIISHGSKLLKGRIASCKENGLKEGDDCVFEKMEGKNSVLKVTIFRADEDGLFPCIKLDLTWLLWDQAVSTIVLWPRRVPRFHLL